MRLEIDATAWNRGFTDGEQGRGRCPYPRGTTESWLWSSGWIEGDAARQGFKASHPYALMRSQKRAPAAETSAVPLRYTAPASAAGQSAKGRQQEQEKGVNIARRSGVKVRRRLTVIEIQELGILCESLNLLHFRTRM